MQRPLAFRTVVVPLDGSDLAERALPYVTALARAVGAAELILVSAVPSVEQVLTQSATGDAFVPPVVIDVEKTVESSRQDSNGYLARMADRLRTDGDLKVATVVVEGDPAARVVELANERNADLIVLSTHGRSGLERAVFGSVTDAVVRSATCPVLVIPSRIHAH